MSNNNTFTEGKIFAPLIKFALPVLFALFMQALYGAVDLLIVGQFGGDKAEIFVSAVSTVVQIALCFLYIGIFQKRKRICKE